MSPSLPNPSFCFAFVKVFFFCSICLFFGGMGGCFGRFRVRWGSEGPQLT